uniref:Amidase domain-containing protein n=1 Tax=Tetranychus urticae TaxID=32264 RepID=T1KYA6_TETUR
MVNQTQILSCTKSFHDHFNLSTLSNLSLIIYKTLNVHQRKSLKQFKELINQSCIKSMSSLDFLRQTDQTKHGEFDDSLSSYEPKNGLCSPKNNIQIMNRSTMKLSSIRIAAKISMRLHNRMQRLPALNCPSGLEYLTKIEKFVVNHMMNHFTKLLGPRGLIICPTLPIPAVKHRTTLLNGFDPSYTMFSNVISFPSTHCPTGLTKEGLPVGFQIIVPPFNDNLAITMACEVEKLFGGWISPSAVNC